MVVTGAGGGKMDNGITGRDFQFYKMKRDLEMGGETV